MTMESREATPEPSPAPRASGGLGVAAILCLVLATLFTTPAIVGYWTQRTLNDTGRYVDTVGPLASESEVQTAVATRVTTAIEKQVDLEAILNEAFAGVITKRPRLELLVGPMVGAISGLIETQVRTFLASDTFEDLWIAANTRLQQTLVRVLEGNESGAVSLEGDQVVLDVSEVIDQVKQRLVDRGLTMIEDLPIPTVDRQIELFDAPRLARARTTYAAVNPVAQWLIVICAVLYLAAIVLSRRRAKMTVIVGVALAANALLVGAAVSVGRQMFINTLAGTELAPASTVVYDTLLAFLTRGQRVLLWLGLILVVAGWYMGRNAIGSTVRKTVSGGLESVGAPLADGPVAGPGRWVSANAGWLRVVVVVLGGVVLFWGNQVSEAQLVWATVLVVGLLMVVQVLVGAGRVSPHEGEAAAPHQREPAITDSP